MEWKNSRVELSHHVLLFCYIFMNSSRNDIEFCGWRVPEKYSATRRDRGIERQQEGMELEGREEDRERGDTETLKMVNVRGKPVPFAVFKLFMQCWHS